MFCQEILNWFFSLGECSDTQFQCISGICTHEDDSDCKGSCIPKSWVKDGMADCTDGSDELVGKTFYLNNYD